MALKDAFKCKMNPERSDYADQLRKLAKDKNVELREVTGSS